MSSRFTKTHNATLRARDLRREATEAEKRLWRSLQSAQLGGASFRRQHPIGRYIVDFCAPALKLIVELDGSQHAKADNAVNDEARTAWLNAQGYSVLRF